MSNVLVTPQVMGRLTASCIEEAFHGTLELTPELIHGAFELGFNVGRLLADAGIIMPDSSEVGAVVPSIEKSR